MRYDIPVCLLAIAAVALLFTTGWLRAIFLGICIGLVVHLVVGFQESKE